MMEQIVCFLPLGTPHLNAACLVVLNGVTSMWFCAGAVQGAGWSLLFNSSRETKGDFTHDWHYNLKRGDPKWLDQGERTEHMRPSSPQEKG